MVADPIDGPFPSSLDHVLAELQWIAARSKRIHAKRKTPTSDCGCQLAALREQEDRLRASIDARLVKNQAEGPTVGLDTLTNLYGLDEFERMTVLLGVVPVLGSTVAEEILGSSHTTIGFGGDIDVEVVWDLLEYSPEGRLHSLLSLIPTASLIRERLVTISREPCTPGDLSGASVEITGPALAVLTGIDEFASIGSQTEGDE